MNAVVILGSTGSIGANVLDVIRRHPDRYRIIGLAANTDADAMARQCAEFKPETVVMADESAAAKLSRALKSQTQVDAGADAVCALAGGGADIIICGIVGAAGLQSTLAAVRGGGKVLIANKEPLVMMGAALMREARAHGTTVIPLDSEHNAIFQCLPSSLHGVGDGDGARHCNSDSDRDRQAIKKIWLTASGGPFRQTPAEQFRTITPQQARAHPTWQMGAKISVDSATLMNKGLELIEACVLFSLDVDDIQIVIHPQSVIHSMVEYADGSVLAQLGNPDMRIAIANALGFPERIASGARSLNFLECARFDFEAPDHDRFPSLNLAQIAARVGGVMPAVMNAANEIAVAAFLDGSLSFDNIPRMVKRTMDEMHGVADRHSNSDSHRHGDGDSNSDSAEHELKTVLTADRHAREFCAALCDELRDGAQLQLQTAGVA